MDRDFEDVLKGLNGVINKMKLGKSFMDSYKLYGDREFLLKSEAFYRESKECFKECEPRIDKFIKNLSSKN